MLLWFIAECFLFRNFVVECLDITVVHGRVSVIVEASLLLLQ